RGVEDGHLRGRLPLRALPGALHPPLVEDGKLRGGQPRSLARDRVAALLGHPALAHRADLRVLRGPRAHPHPRPGSGRAHLLRTPGPPRIGRQPRGTVITRSGRSPMTLAARFTPSKRGTTYLWDAVCAVLAGLAMVVGEAHAQQILLPTSPAEVPGPAPGTAMTRAYVQALARTAYVWGWPLVNSHNRRATRASGSSRTTTRSARG